MASPGFAPEGAAVVGGGIAGLTTALLLSRLGVAVTVFDPSTRPGDLGAGILLQPNGLAVLDGLGLAEQVASSGRQLRTLEIRDVRGRLIAEQPVPEFGEGLDHAVAIRRRDLHRVLLQAVENAPAIALRLGAGVVATDPDGRVEFRCGDATDATTFGLVVGADGIGSGVRTRGRFDAVLGDRRTSYVRGLVDTAGPEPFVEHWTPLGAFGSAPVTDRLTYFYAAAYRGAAEAAVQDGDLASLRTAWRGVLPAAGAVLDRVASFDDLIVSGVRTVRCRRWVDGRLVLVGDAAHAMAPNAGQGANSAIVDAAVLAEELARPQALASSLERYQQRRRGKVLRVQSLADQLALLSGLRGGPARTARAALFRAAGALAGPLERQLRSVQQEDPASLRIAVRQLVAS